MGESIPTPRVHKTTYPEQVKAYVKKGLEEPDARSAVAKDLALQRTRRDIQKKNDEILEARKLSDEAQKLSLFDALTGLPNRRALFGDKNANPPLIGKLDEVFGHSSRHQEHFSIVILDLDWFKKYNDKHGHIHGDTALHELARVIRNSIREEDFAARYGGEEFAVILPNTDKQQAQKLIERLRLNVQNMPFEGSKGVIDDNKAVLLQDPITISAGLTDYNPVTDSNISSPKVLFDRADKLLYRAKEEGRNRVKC